MKNVKDLKYPDVIHIQSEEEYNKIKKYQPSLNHYDKGYLYYLIGGGMSARITNYKYEDSDYIIYEMNEIIFEENEKFIKGQWYKTVNDYYFKYDYTEKRSSYNKIYTSISINNSKHVRKNGYFANVKYENNAVLLTDLSEIQQYLPNNHVDKIQKNPQIGEFWFFDNGLYKIEDIIDDNAVITSYCKSFAINKMHYSLDVMKTRNVWKKAEFKNIDKTDMTLEQFNEVDAYFNNTLNSTISNNFPKEGCIYEDVNKLNNIAKYLINRVNNRYDGKTNKENAIGIGWNGNSYWWLKTKTSQKREYGLNYLERILNANKETFKSQDDNFVLSDDWYIKVTNENKKTINDWKIKQEYNQDLFESNHIYVQKNGAGFSLIEKNREYQEITFEQFKKYVLKEKELVETKVEFTSPKNIQNTNKEIIIPTIVKNKTEIIYNVSQKTNEIVLTLPKIERIIIKPITVKNFTLTI